MQQYVGYRGIADSGVASALQIYGVTASSKSPWISDRLMGITAVPITEAIGRRPCVVSGVQGDRLSATIPENQFKTEIDMARSTAREHQFGGGGRPMASP